MGGVISRRSRSRRNGNPEQNGNRTGNHRREGPTGTNFTDDYLTEEEFHFVKDNMYSFRKTRRCENLEFYKNRLKSKPAPGHTIAELLNMKGNYELMDNVFDQSCLQWLFPIPDSSGKNEHAQSLQLREIKAIKSNKTLKARFLSAYVMMLDFYGMRLNSDITGEVSRSPRWEHRYTYFNGSHKHLMRITRILITLGCLGFAHFQFPWIAFMLNEIFDHNKLQVPMASVNFWIEAVSDDNDKAECKRMLDGFITSVDSVYLNEYPNRHQGVRTNYPDSYWRCQGGESRNDRLACQNDNNQSPLFPTAPPLDDLSVFTSSDFLTDDEFAIISQPTHLTSDVTALPKQEYKSPKEHGFRNNTLRKENDRLKEERTCKICLDQDVTSAVIPCGHAVACGDCAKQLKQCPVCRGPIKNILRIYMN